MENDQKQEYNTITSLTRNAFCIVCQWLFALHADNAGGIRRAAEHRKSGGCPREPHLVCSV